MAIEADHYRQEEEWLKARPEIRAMADEVQSSVDGGLLTAEDLASHGFMTMALNEWQRRRAPGAECPHGASIGGPARAVRALLADLDDPPPPAGETPADPPPLPSTIWVSADGVVARAIGATLSLDGKPPWRAYRAVR